MQILVNNPIFEQPIKNRMSKIQQKFTAILRAKKTEQVFLPNTKTMWERGDNSPTLERSEKVCLDNGISLFSLIEFDTHILIKIMNLEAEKTGAKLVITFESK